MGRENADAVLAENSGLTAVFLKLQKSASFFSSKDEIIPLNLSLLMIIGVVNRVCTL